MRAVGRKTLKKLRGNTMGHAPKENCDKMSFSVMVDNRLLCLEQPGDYAVRGGQF